MQTHRPLNALPKEKQDAAIAAFDKAGDLAIKGGADEKRVREVLRRHTADIGLNDTGHAVLLIEMPLFRSRPPGFEYLPQWNASVGIVGGVGDDAVPGPHTMDAIVAHFLSTNVEIRPMELLDGVRLLASDDSPAAFLAERRARLAELRADSKHRLEVAAQMARQREEADARWRFENGDRQRAWEATAKPIQILHDALEPLPQYADLREALCASLAKYGDHVNRYVPMPASFRPELARTPGTARGAPNPRVLAPLGLKIKETDAPPASTPAAEVRS